jgi:hypothetical protein
MLVSYKIGAVTTLGLLDFFGCISLPAANYTFNLVTLGFIGSTEIIIQGNDGGSNVWGAQATQFTITESSSLPSTVVSQFTNMQPQAGACTWRDSNGPGNRQIPARPGSSRAYPWSWAQTSSDRLTRSSTSGIARASIVRSIDFMYVRQVAQASMRVAG